MITIRIPPLVIDQRRFYKPTHCQVNLFLRKQDRRAQDICATVSVIAGLYLVLVPTNGSKLLHAIYCFMQNAEISFMAFLIFYFLLSLKEMSVLVGAIHNDKGAKTDKEIKELKEKIQSKQNQ